MVSETQRIEKANESLWQRVFNQLPVGRKVTQEDEEGIARVRESNLKARKKLFGSKEYVWYLKYTQVVGLHDRLGTCL